MPFADIGSLTLYYEVFGEGREESLVLINGLGSDHREWLYQVPVFKKHFQVVTFDNRGTGVSGTPPGPYTTDQMAGDVDGLMESLGIERAHILGVSMGGLIAQKVAVLYPERVNHLVLACAAVGGEESIKPSAEAMEAFVSFNQEDPEGSLKKMLPYLYTGEFIQREDPEIDRFIRFALNKPQNQEGYMSQLAAISSHSSFRELLRIKAETLVITGGEDRLIPPQNSHILAEGIPRAHLTILPGAPHRLFAEGWDKFNGKILEFLKKG